MNSISKKDVFIYIFIPILIGSLGYYFLCPEVWFVNKIDKILLENANNSVINEFIFHIRNSNHFSLDNVGYTIFRFYFFDIVWAFSFTATVLFITNPTREKIIYIEVLIFIFEIVCEFSQLFNFVNGTFDVLDIAAEIFINILVIKILIWRKY